MKKIIMAIALMSAPAFAQTWECVGNEPNWRATFGQSAKVSYGDNKVVTGKVIDSSTTTNNIDVLVKRFHWGSSEFVGVAVIRKESCRESMKDTPDSHSISISAHHEVLVGCCTIK